MCLPLFGAERRVRECLRLESARISTWEIARVWVQMLFEGTSLTYDEAK